MCIECISPILIEESTNWKFEFSSLRTLDCAVPPASRATQSLLQAGEDSEITVRPNLLGSESENAQNSWLFQILMD